MLTVDDLLDRLQLLAMRCGIREVRKLQSDECDDELVEARREYLRDAKRRERARNARP
jgi:hypothetical protein